MSCTEGLSPEQAKLFNEVVDLAAKLSDTEIRDLKKLRKTASENGTDHEYGITVDRLVEAIFETVIDERR